MERTQRQMTHEPETTKFELKPEQVKFLISPQYRSLANYTQLHKAVKGRIQNRTNQKIN